MLIIIKGGQVFIGKIGMSSSENITISIQDLLLVSYLQTFCGNKTLKHFYWKFQHKPTGSNNWVTGTIYNKIRYKVLFSCYFKSGHCQGTENATITKINNITKDFSGDKICHKVKQISPFDFQKVPIQDWNY